MTPVHTHEYGPEPAERASLLTFHNNVPAGAAVAVAVAVAAAEKKNEGLLTVMGRGAP